MKIKKRGVIYRLDISKYINPKTGLIEIPSFAKNLTQKEFLQYLIDNNPSMECIEEVISKEGERAERNYKLSSMSDFDYFHQVDLKKHKRRIRKQRNIHKWLEFGLDLYPYEKHLSDYRKWKIRLRKLKEEDKPQH